MRTPGAKNKPKITYIPLAKLCQTLQDDTLVPVCIKFAESLQLNSNIPNNNPKVTSPLTVKPKNDTIDFTVTS